MSLWLYRRAAIHAAVCCVAVFLTPLRASDDSSTGYSVLQKNCFGCHGSAKMSGLDLRTAETALAGGAHGAVIVPADPEQSKLYKQVTHVAEPAMPPGKKLSDDDIETLRVWIEAGAPFPKIDAKEADAAEKATMAKQEERPITPEERNYWAFRPVNRQVAPPAVSDAAWKANPIDAFALAAMKAKGLKPSAPADKRTLVRRAYLDLIGLPPTPPEMDEFLNDKSPDAWSKLVDKLLASPHYGERWARHWLDLARYADSDGFEFDRDRTEAWRYRDYVVKAFNDDKPYDRFIKEQLAGDEYVTKDTPPDAARESIIATGFLRLGPSGGGGGERGKQDSLDDIITTTSMTFFGMTVGCARCHNHKFDPIPQKDYYRIQAVFYSTRPNTYALVSQQDVAKYRAEVNRITELQRPFRKAKAELEAPYQKRLVEEAISKLPEYLQAAWRTPADKRTDGQKLNVQQIQKTLTNDTLAHKIDEPMIVSLMTDEERKKHQELSDKIAELDSQKPAMYPTAMATTDSGSTPQPSYFLQRGILDARGSLMTPGVLSVASSYEYVFPAPPGAQTTWRRRGFAEWIASPDNPLTARVMVNRIWQHHFGEGIVRTPSNFGKMGEAPSHPELLDWLAAKFVENGWSVKAMHRLMMNSQLYRMASDDNMADLGIDPENRYFWRMPRERLEAEILRDEILAVAGTLNPTVGGPCIFPFIPPDIFQGSSHRTWPGKADDDPATFRRSIYVFSKRSIRYPLFEAYDQPNLINTCDRRNRSTIAPQALMLMNDNFVITQANLFAARLRKDAGSDKAAQINRAFLLALGRTPTASEKASSLAFLNGAADRLPEFCQAMFNLNEFAYRQ